MTIKDSSLAFDARVATIANVRVGGVLLLTRTTLATEATDANYIHTACTDGAPGY
eukprot:SAG31_NODE_5191_length_2689_cov_3.062934_3_plen_55_part_00